MFCFSLCESLNSSIKHGIMQEKLNCPVHLAELLLKLGVDSTTVEILKEEGLTRRTLADVTEDDLRELKIKMGPRKLILQIIKAHKNQLQTLTINPVEFDKGTYEVDEFEATYHEPELTTQTQNPVKEEKSTNDIDEFEVTYDEPFPEIRTDEISHDEAEISCSVISIRKWVESHKQGQQLIQVLDNKVYTSEDRCLLVRIVVGEMMKICGSAYPSSEMKNQIAKQIINEFPCLRSAREDACGHEHFYDKNSGTGFLEYRLKTVRRHIPPSKKRRKSGKKVSQKGVGNMVSKLKFDTNLLNIEDLEKKVIWMKLTKPTDCHKSAILSALEETRANRQNEIHNHKPTITDILNKYPRLADFNGEMIDREFKWLHPNANDFVEKFSFYAVRILKYVEARKPHLLPLVSDFDDNLKALALLPDILPPVNYIKKKEKQVKKLQKKCCQKNFPSSHLLKFVNANEDFTADTEIEATQPYMVCRTVSSGKTGRFFLRLDQKYLEVADNVVTAFDLLFKSHFVFNVQYSEELQNFYDFICGCIYKIDTPNPSSDGLHSCLLNVPVPIDSLV